MGDSTQKYHELMLSGYFEKKVDDTTTLEEVGEALKKAEEFKLLTEVVYTALKQLQKSPKTSLADALSIALLEWDIS